MKPEIDFAPIVIAREPAFARVPDNLRGKAYVQAYHDLVAIRNRYEKEKPTFLEAIYEAVKVTPGDSIKFYIDLKRAVYNDQFPRIVNIIERIDAMELCTFSWGSDLKRISCEAIQSGQRFDQEWKGERDRLKALYREFLEDSDVAASLLLTSRRMLDELEKGVSENIGAKKFKASASTIYNLVARCQFKCSPFAFFCTSRWLLEDTETTSDISESDTLVAVTANLNLLKMLEWLVKGPKGATFERLSVNDTLVESSEFFEFFVNNGGADAIRRVRRSNVVNSIVQKYTNNGNESDKQYESIRELGCSSEESAVLERLISAGVLVKDESISRISRDWIEAFRCKHAGGIMNDEGVSDGLSKVLEVQSGIGRGEGRELSNRLSQLSEAWDSTFNAIIDSLGMDGTTADPMVSRFSQHITVERLVYCDAFKSTKHENFDSYRRTIEELGEWLLAASTVGDPTQLSAELVRDICEGELSLPIVDFYRRFNRLRQDARVVDREEAFEKKFSKAKRLFSSIVQAKVQEAVAEEREFCIDVQDIIASAGEAVLDEGKVWQPLSAALQRSTESPNRYVVSEVSPGFGQRLSRFFVKEFAKERETFCGWLRKAKTYEQCAEIRDNIYFNANVHVPIYKKEIVFPAAAASGRAVSVLRLSGLVVSLERGFPEIREKENGSRVIPVDVELLASSARSGMFEVFKLFTGTRFSNVNWLITAIDDSLMADDRNSKIVVTYPRIVFGNHLIIRRRRWFVPSLESIKARSLSCAEHLKLLLQWEKNRLPLRFYIPSAGVSHAPGGGARKRKPQYIDMLNLEGARRLMIHATRCSGGFVIEEADPLAVGSEEGECCERIVHWRFLGE